MQTQMSFVFLTGEYAYKIKKPVNLGYLDYTTLEKRLFFCRQELELNRRLSPDVYLEVVPIIENDGHLRLGGSGNVIEYAVKMKQLPADRTMDILLSRDQITIPMIEQVAGIMADFHKKAATGPEINAFGEIKAIRFNIDENFAQTEKYIGTIITGQQFEELKTYNTMFIDSNVPLFQKRIAEGRIKDCHGDLHAAHICFGDRVHIFDCIEFNDRFRYGDTTSEIAFLAMDIDRYGRADLSQALVNAYIKHSGDEDIRRLLPFYKCYKAYVRGKVESFKFDDPLIADKAKAQEAARIYFNLARRYTRERPLLIIMNGLTGTGKSSIADALGRSLGFTILSSDVTRKQLAGISPQEHRFDEFNKGIYSPEFHKNTYDMLISRASDLLKQEHMVIIDAAFGKKEERMRARAAAENVHADFYIIECVLDETEALHRLDERLKAGSISDGRPEVYRAQKVSFDTIDEIPLKNHIKLDTMESIYHSIQKVSERIFE
jgi:uncharacterized protein